MKGVLKLLLKWTVGLPRSSQQRLKMQGAWRYYWNLYAPERGRILVATLSAIGQSAALLPVPLLIGYLLDKAIVGNNLRAVQLAGAAVLVAHLIYSGLVFFTRRSLVVADTNAMTEFRGD